MDPLLRSIVKEVKQEVASNPPEEGDDATALIEAIVDQQLSTAFSEDDMIEAAMEMGVEREDIPAFLEMMASYLGE